MGYMRSYDDMGISFFYLLKTGSRIQMHQVVQSKFISDSGLRV